MNECVMCGALLPAPLDTFGDWRYPVCQSCWLEPEPDNPYGEIFVRVALPNGGSALRKGRDYNAFFEIEEPAQ